MARFNKIHLGPAALVATQVREAIASVAISPGKLIVIDGSGEFALAVAATTGKVWLAQDNYLAMLGTDDDWDAGDTAIGMELSPEHIYAGRIANGTDIAAIGTPLTTAANGLITVAGAGDKVIGYSEEAYNNTTGSEQLIKFRPGQSHIAA